MNERGEIKNCIVEGPISYDCAIDKEIAEFKGFHSEVSGDVDVLVAPNIHAGKYHGQDAGMHLQGKNGRLYCRREMPDRTDLQRFFRRGEISGDRCFRSSCKIIAAVHGAAADRCCPAEYPTIGMENKNGKITDYQSRFHIHKGSRI